MSCLGVGRDNERLMKFKRGEFLLPVGKTLNFLRRPVYITPGIIS